MIMQEKCEAAGESVTLKERPARGEQFGAPASTSPPVQPS